MSKYLDPKADVVFKKIFGDHPHLLISFLNAVLPLPPDSLIVQLSYLPSEQVPILPGFKRTIADVKCKDATGRIFIVEMQINWSDSFKQRLLFGASQAFVKQLKKGEEFNLLQPVYGLGIVAEIYEKTSSEWYHHYQFVKKSNLDTSDIIEHLQLIFIELPKFPIRSSDEKKLRLLWLRFLREIGEKTKTVSKELLNVPEIAQAVKLSEESAYTPEELQMYDSYWDAVSREKTLMLDKYIEGIAKGRVEGIAEGIAKGKVEGIAEGITKGKVEGIAEGITKGEIEEKRKIAKKLLKQGIAIKIVMSVTDLTKLEVEAIQKKL